MAEITIKATVANLEQVLALVDTELEKIDCPMKAQMQIDIAIDELFGNIAHYAYGENGGEVTVGIEMEDNPQAAVITFIDSGVPLSLIHI